MNVTELIAHLEKIKSERGGNTPVIVWNGNEQQNLTNVRIYRGIFREYVSLGWD